MDIYTAKRTHGWTANCQVWCHVCFAKVQSVGSSPKFATLAEIDAVSDIKRKYAEHLLEAHSMAMED
jgi:hypothetical protein